MVTTALASASSSLVRPPTSGPKTRAVGTSGPSCASQPGSSRGERRGMPSRRSRVEVVPITRRKGASAWWRSGTRSIPSRTCLAPTAKAVPILPISAAGSTRSSRSRPMLAIARAAEPTFPSSRGRTRTTAGPKGLPEPAAQLALEGAEGLLAVEGQDDPVQLRPPLEEAVDLGEHDPRGAVEREAEIAGGDRRQGDRPQAPAVGQRQGGSYGGGELLVLVPLPHPRPHGVDHPPGFEIPGAGHHRSAHGRAADAVALDLDRGAPLLADRAGDPGAQLEVLVGGVDDGVHVELGDVPLEQLEPSVVQGQGHPIVGPVLGHLCHQALPEIISAPSVSIV